MRSRFLNAVIAKPERFRILHSLHLLLAEVRLALGLQLLVPHEGLREGGVVEGVVQVRVGDAGRQRGQVLGRALLLLDRHGL